MLWLVETDLASAGKPNFSDRTPSGLLHLRTPDAFFPECRHLRPYIVTHEIEFVPVTVFGGMNCHFCRRQREDQPSMARFHRCKSGDVPQEGAISCRILAVHNYTR